MRLHKVYGLIAEEVNEIYREVVVRDAQGEIYSINYINLIPMLLAQIQTLQKEVDTHERMHQEQQLLINECMNYIKEQQTKTGACN